MLNALLFAQEANGFELGNPMVWGLAGVVLVVMFFFSILLLYSKQYKRCPSNRVLVIYGKADAGRRPGGAHAVHGGAAIRGAI